MVNRYESLANELVNAKIVNQKLTAQVAERNERVELLEWALKDQDAQAGAVQDYNVELKKRVKVLGERVRSIGGLTKPEDIAFPISADRVQPDRDGGQVTLYDMEQRTVGFMYNIDDWLVQQAIDGINKAALDDIKQTIKDAAMSDGIKKAIESADQTNRELDEKSEAPPLDNIPLMTALDEKTEGSE